MSDIRQVEQAGKYASAAALAVRIGGSLMSIFSKATIALCFSKVHTKL